MLQHLALHLNEGLLPGRMHEFQDKFTPINRREVEIIVVLAGERLGGDFEAENFARDANGFYFSDRLGYARFWNHAGNLIRKGRTASILVDELCRKSEMRNAKFEIRNAKLEMRNSKLEIKKRPRYISSWAD